MVVSNIDKENWALGSMKNILPLNLPKKLDKQSEIIITDGFLTMNSEQTIERSIHVTNALKQGSHPSLHKILFDYDAPSYFQFDVEQRTKLQIQQLDDDTKVLHHESNQKLALFCSLANYVEKNSTVECARVVFDYVHQNGFAVSNLEFYKTWALFEIRNNCLKNAKQTLVICSNLLKQNNYTVEEMFEKMIQEQKANNDSMMNISNDIENSKMIYERNSDSLSSKSISTLHHNHRVKPKGSLSKKSALHLSSGVAGKKLNKLGRAKRVAIQANSAIEDELLSTDPDKTSDKQETIENKKKSKMNLSDVLGDFSYITNWKPDNPKSIQSNDSSSRNSSLTDNFSHRSSPVRKVPRDDITAETPREVLDSSSKENKVNSIQPKKGNIVRFHENLKKKDDNLTNPNYQLDSMTLQQSFNSYQNIDQIYDSTSLTLCNKSEEVLEILEKFKKSISLSKNIFIVNNQPYLRLTLIGRGGSSKVFKVLSLNNEENEPQMYALKRIKLQRTDQKSLASYVNEIKLMDRLRCNPNIISLIDSEVNLEKRVIYMIMEHGEIDLGSLLQQKRKTSSENGLLSMNFIRMIWMSMLEAVQAIHEERIVHGDLKPANFLFVQGVVKLIDFGIAKAISNDTTNILRDSQVGTLNYMSPEAIIDTNSCKDSRPKVMPGIKLKQGRASDIWSMGCILYQMVYGHPPFFKFKLVQKIHCISDPNHKISYPPINPPYPDLINTIQSCLCFLPYERAPILSSSTAIGLMDHPFLNPQSSLNLEFAKRIIKDIVKDVVEHSQKLENIKNQNPLRLEEITSALAQKFYNKIDNFSRSNPISKKHEKSQSLSSQQVPNYSMTSLKKDFDSKSDCLPEVLVETNMKNMNDSSLINTDIPTFGNNS